MNVWPRIKNLTVLLLVSLALNALACLFMPVPFIVMHFDVSSLLDHRMLPFLMRNILLATLASSLIPALLMLFNYRLTAYGALVISFLFCFQLPQTTVLGQVLMLFWIVGVIMWLVWNKLRDLYRYYRVK
ncbi:hypothetical protein [Pseudomonas fluorescens]|uniref:Uncharacterized protein n=1 Tax=Pseudomonas fluorescens TaxID=294 RepID=A0A0F4TMM4_PSEFL|nr:hypothetical protein [Pseudomonas fluorescens]KJZ44652.1 hypothetical protein VC34_11880 [Pseudomonas fluorescens]